MALIVQLNQWKQLHSLQCEADCRGYILQAFHSWFCFTEKLGGTWEDYTSDIKAAWCYLHLMDSREPLSLSAYQDTQSYQSFQWHHVAMVSCCHGITLPWYHVAMVSCVKSAKQWDKLRKESLAQG